MSSKLLLSSKLTIFLLLVLLGFLANVKFKQWQIQKAINKEKQSLSQQADALEKKNNELSQSLSYLNSDDFKERVARQQLGLKKEGEEVFDFTISSGADATTSKASETKTTNFQKWWDYFTQNQ